MFKNKKYQKNLKLDEDFYEEYLKRVSSYFNSKKVVTKRVVEDSYFILEEIQKKQNKREAEKKKYQTKNLIILKYQDEIIKLFKDGYGVRKIEEFLKLNHKVSVSKSTLNNFLKDNEIVRDG